MTETGANTAVRTDIHGGDLALWNGEFDPRPLDDAEMAPLILLLVRTIPSEAFFGFWRFAVLELVFRFLVRHTQ